MGAEGVNPRLAQHFTGATSFLVVKLISDTIASVASSILLLHIASPASVLQQNIQSWA
jgi:hypothetical protein